MENNVEKQGGNGWTVKKEKAGERFNSPAFLVKQTNQSADGARSDTANCTKTK